METIIYEKRDRIAYVTLNRPQALNAINLQMMEELRQVWRDFAEDPDLWVAVVTGAGDRSFSAGHDLKEDASGAMDEEFRKRHWQSTEDNPMLMTMGTGTWKPVIAAVNGHCLAGGMEIALACDLRVASENARFGLPQVKVGLMPSFAGVLLSRAVPLAFAMRMLLTGEPIDAAEAHRVGLVNEVVPLPELMPAAEKLARAICQNAPLGVRGAKRATLTGLDIPVASGLMFEHQLALRVRESEDAREGATAFAEKRPPQYRAR